MTLQLSGAISFADIQTIFGGTNPIGLNEYYTNDASGFTTGVSGLPSTGSAISLQLFYGKSKISDLYTFSTHTFTNAGATGRTGPIISQVRTAYSTAAWAQNNSYLSMTTQGIQLWTVPATGSYTFRIAGAKGGGDGSGYVGGEGRIVNITCTLTQNQIIKIVVGQIGGTFASSYDTGGGGGGGTYVTTSDNSIIGIGGGGGGAKYGSIWGSKNGQTAPAATYGLSSTGGSSANNGAGGTYQDQSYAGGGGGGYSGNGSGRSGYADLPSLGGVAFLNGSTGGYGYLYYNQANGGADGGFGGGGGLWINSEARSGGGGGYSGGDGTSYDTGTLGGGGGGSFLGVLNITSASYGGTNSGNGSVVITANFTITETPTLYTFTTHTFTNAGSLGANGPILSQCRTSYSSASWTQDTTNNYLNMTTRGIQQWKVPSTGTYTIEMAGAAGGFICTNGTARPGYGYKISANISLVKGNVLNIVVGQRGVGWPSGNTLVASFDQGAGGGGASCVFEGTTLYMIAAGGNGQSWDDHTVPDPDGQSTGATNTLTSQGRGNKGATFNANGDGDANAALSILNGAVGGNPNGGYASTGVYTTTSHGQVFAGGFGGGGGTAPFEGGGGGGYQAGITKGSNQYTSTYTSQGATSYIAGTLTATTNMGTNTSGTVSDYTSLQGYVKITKV